MKDVFTDKADLSRIDGTKSLKVTDVVHQAFVEVSFQYFVTPFRVTIDDIKIHPIPYLRTFKNLKL